MVYGERIIARTQPIILGEAKEAVEIRAMMQPTRPQRNRKNQCLNQSKNRQITTKGPGRANLGEGEREPPQES
jgi:hypothetical protein